MCFYGSQNKQRLFPYTTLTDLFYSRVWVCLLRGTNWIFYIMRYLFVLKLLAVSTPVCSCALSWGCELLGLVKYWWNRAAWVCGWPYTVICWYRWEGCRSVMSHGMLQCSRSDCSLNTCVHFLIVRDHALMIRYGRQKPTNAHTNV
jgi:hypothetical protein